MPVKKKSEIIIPQLAHIGSNDGLKIIIIFKSKVIETEGDRKYS